MTTDMRTLKATMADPLKELYAGVLPQIEDEASYMIEGSEIENTHLFGLEAFQHGAVYGLILGHAIKDDGSLLAKVSEPLIQAMSAMERGLGQTPD